MIILYSLYNLFGNKSYCRQVLLIKTFLLQYSIDMAHNTDIFLSHNWGRDKLGRNNHDRVSTINKELKNLGYRTWFDEERIKGEIVNRMADGIERTQCVIVFITKKYLDKVTGERANDNCRLEFDYAARTKSSSKMIAVVMEKDMCDTTKWKRLVGMHIGGKKFIDMSGEFNDKTYLNQTMKHLQDELQFMGIKRSNTVDKNNENVKLLTGIFVFFYLSIFWWSSI